MTVTPDVETLHDQNHKALLDFLTVELELGFTFMEIAKDEADPEHRQRLRARAEQVIEVIERFSSRIEDPAAKSAIERRAATLKGLIAEAPAQKAPAESRSS